MADSDEKENDSSGLSWAKKLMTVGVGTFFLTEEALRALTAQFNLPKEIVTSVLDGAKNVRKEFIQNFTAEMIGRVTEKVDPAAIIAEFLKQNEVTLEIKVKVKDKKIGEDSGVPGA
jgi:hypothetical protein